MPDQPPGIDVPTLLNQQEWMKSLAYQMVFDDQRADDIVQDAVIAALRPQPAPVESPRAWLTTVVRNLARRGYRDRTRRDRREHKAARDEIQLEDDVVERAELHGLVTNEALALEEPYRSTILLRFFDGLEPTEIAKRLHLPAATVRVRLKRALDQLRGRMDEVHGRDRTTWCVAFVSLFRIRPPLTSIGISSPSNGSSLPQAGGKLLQLGSIIVTTKKLTASLMVGVVIAGLSYVALTGENKASERGLLQTTATSASNLDGLHSREASDSTASIPQSTANSTTPRRTLQTDGPEFAFRVLLADTDTPVVGAPILLHEAKSDLVVSCETDANGNVAVRAPSGRYRLMVKHPTLVLKVPTAHEHGPNRTPFTLRLYPGGELVGRVLDRATSEPVADVLVHAEIAGGWTPRETRSDEQGNFRLEGLAITPYNSRVTWKTRGFLPPRRFNHNSVSLASGESREDFVLLLDRGATVRGKSIDESDKPVAGVSVAFLPQLGGREVQESVSDANGNYEVTVLPGKYHIHAASEGLALVMGPLRIDWGDHRQDLMLESGATISGRLEDETRSGLADQVVYFRSKMTGRIEASVTTDEQGKFAATGLGSEGYDVAGTFDGQAAGDQWQSIFVSPGESVEGVVITLAINRHLAIRGQVTDATGAPQPWQTVTAISSTSTHSATTGEDGRYTLLCLEDTEYTVSWGDQERKVMAGTEDVDFSPPSTQMQQDVTIRVVDAAGKPVPLFASIVRRGRTSTGSLAHPTYHSTATIEFSRTGEEQVHVRVAAPDVGNGEIVVQPDPEGAPTLELTLRLKPVLDTVVRVIDSQGNPVSAARVFDGRIATHGARDLGLTQDDGTFKVLDAQIVTLFVQHPDHAPASLELRGRPEGEELEVVLPTGVRLTGRVHRGSEALAANVSISFPALGSLQPQLDERGRFEAVVPEGFLSVSATIKRDSGDGPPRRFARQVSARGRSLAVDFNLPQLNSTLAGSVWEGDEPKPSAEITVVVQLRSGLVQETRARSNESGTFEIVDLPAGEAVLSVVEFSEGQTRMPATTKVTLTPNRVTEAKLEIASNTEDTWSVRGTVLTLRDHEQGIVMIARGTLAAADITVANLQKMAMESAIVARGEIKEGGTYELSQLPAGNYTILALAMTEQPTSAAEFAEKVRFALSPVEIKQTDVDANLTLP